MIFYILRDIRLGAFKQKYNFDVAVGANPSIRDIIIKKVLSNKLNSGWSESKEKSSYLKMPDVMLEEKETGGHLILVFLDEGSCNHFDKINRYIEQMVKGRLNSNAYLLLIYSKPEEMYKDIYLSRDILNNSYYRSRVIKTNIDDLKEKNTAFINIKNEEFCL